MRCSPYRSGRTRARIQAKNRRHRRLPDWRNKIGDGRQGPDIRAPDAAPHPGGQKTQMRKSPCGNTARKGGLKFRGGFDGAVFWRGHFFEVLRLRVFDGHFCEVLRRGLQNSAQQNYLQNSAQQNQAQGLMVRMDFRRGVRLAAGALLCPAFHYGITEHAGSR